MGAFFLAPGVYAREIDLSERVQAIATSVGAAVFGSRKGPLKRSLVTSRQQFLDLYGKPDQAWSYGHHSALAFLTTARQLWVQRVTRYAKHAGVVLANDMEGAAAASTFFTPFPSGRGGDFEVGGFQYQHIVFDAALVALNVVTVNITDGTNPVVVTTTYSGSSDATLQALADAITNSINSTYAVGFANLKKSLAKATVLKVGAGTADDRLIRLVSPEGVTLTITNVGVASGTSQAVATVQDSPALLEIYAENPGAWANDIGVQIRNLDLGTKQRRKLTFSAAPVSGQSFQAAVNLNGTIVQVGPVAYNTSGTQTLTDIRAALLAALGTGADVIIGANNLEAILVAPGDGPDVFNVLDPQFIGSGTLPTVTNVQTLAGIAKDDTFELWVYERSNQLVPVEKHVVSFNKQVDGFGAQQFIEEVINESAGKSSLIRVVFNGNNLAGGLINLPTSSTAGATPITWMAGGNDGEPPQPSEIIAGWNSFEDRSVVSVRILINCGYFDVSVQSKMQMIAEKRRDCFAILDMPPAEQTAQDAVDHRRNVLNLNTSYAGIYTPDLKIRDEYTNLTMFVPPSGYIASIFAYNDAVAAEWFAPAGLNRGLVKNIIGLRHEYTQGEIELLHPNQVNSIIKRPGKGYPVWGAETLQSKASALSNINVRRLLITIEVSLVDALDYTIYEPNDPFTRFQVVQLCTNFLQPIKEGRGLYDYLVVSDEANNKAYHQDLGQLNVDLLLKPTIPVKFVRLSSIITKSGAAFQEIVGLLNGE